MTEPPLRPSLTEETIRPRFDSAAYAAMSRALAGIERDPAEVVGRMQWRAIGRMALYASTQSPFWRERLRPVVRDGAFHEAGWPALPVLTRRDVAEHHEAMQAAARPADDGELLETETSGSTGVPIKFTYSGRSLAVASAMNDRLYAWHGIDTGAPAATIATFPDKELGRYPEGTVSQRWSLRGIEAPHSILAATTPHAQQLEWLGRVPHRYLKTYPTNARELAKEALRSGVKPAAVDAVLTVGELVTPETRALVREVLGGPIIDTYACEEVGKLALQCEVSGQYHVCLANVLMEILDEDDRPVAPGETGRVVVTGLHNHATPFLRYAIGDYATRAEAPCPCGRTLPTLAAIKGRRRNLLTLPDGRRFWLEESTIMRFHPLLRFRQYQVVQTARDRLELRYVPEGPVLAPEAAALDAIAAAIHPHMHVVPVVVEALPRSPGGKYEDVISLVGD